jgi:hypothetical protein
MLEGNDRQVRWEAVPIRHFWAKFKQQRCSEGMTHGGKRGEMTQTLYAHMNKRKKKEN